MDQSSRNAGKYEVVTWQDRLHEARRKKKKDWTIMVYLGGDNNLEEEMVYALKSMFNVGSTDNVAIFAYFDAGLDPVRFPIDNRRERQERLTKLGQQQVQAAAGEGPVSEDHALLAYSEHLARTGSNEVKSVQSTLEEFILNCICDAPAHHYMLVLSGHGSGSAGDFLAARKRFTGLTIPDLSETLRNVAESFAAASATRVYRKMDILGLDSCQMSTAEVAYQVRKHVDFLVGAEGFEPNTGWPFDRMLDSLNRTIGQGRKIVDAAYEAIRNALRGKAQQSPLHDAYRAALAQAKEIFANLPEQEFEPSTVELLAKQAALRLIKDRALEGLNESSEAREEILMESIVRSGLNLAKQIFPPFETQELNELTETVLQLAEDAVLEALPNELADPTVANGIRPESVSLVFPTPKQLAQGVVREYIHFYHSDYTLADVSTDISALDLQQMDPLVALLRRPDGLTQLMKLALRGAELEAEEKADLYEMAPPDEEISDAIVLSHSEAQGYKDEQNVDLWDFCDRLGNRCLQIWERSHQSSILAKQLADCCESVRNVLENRNGLVVLSGYCGPAFQHSHGLSVYFPWYNSTDAAGIEDLAHYATLDFAFGSRWDEFLLAYTDKTQRKRRVTEGASHKSALNRRDGLFLGEPEESAAPADAELAVQDGQIIVRDAVLTVQDYEEISVQNGNWITTKDAFLFVWRGDVTLRDGQIAISDITLQDGDELSVENGRISLGGETLSAKGQFRVRRSTLTTDKGENVSLAEGEDVRVSDDAITVRDGRLTVRDGRLTVRDGRLTVRDAKLQNGERLTVRDGRLTVRDGRLTVRDGRLTVRDGRLTVRDGRLTVRDGDKITSSEQGRFTVRDGRLTVRDGRLTVRDGRLLDRDERFVLQDGEELTVRDGRLTVRGEPVLADGALTVRDGRLTVRDGRLTVRDLPEGERLEVRDGRLTVRGERPDIRDGRLTVRDGRLTVRAAEPVVRDGRLTVRDGRLTVRGGGFTVRDGRLTVRDDGFNTVRDGRLTVRDGRLTVRDGRLTVRDGRLTVRSADFGTVRDGNLTGVRGGLGLVTKIASMKNPPVDWNDCDLIARNL
jgi:hypothetical protein